MLMLINSPIAHAMSWEKRLHVDGQPFTVHCDDSAGAKKNSNKVEICANKKRTACTNRASLLDVQISYRTKWIVHLLIKP